MSYQQVDAQFDKANAYATAANARSEAFVNALTNTVAGLVPPQLDIDQVWPTAPVIGNPATLALTVPAVTFPTDETGTPPDVPQVNFDIGNAPSAPALSTFTFTPSAKPEFPTLATLNTPNLPASPADWTPPPAPSFLTINIQPFSGLNSYGDFVGKLSNMPADLTLAAPTGYQAPDVQRYDSALLQAMTTLLRGRINGGTGLAPEVEQAIWDRARSRESATSQAAIDDIVRNAESRGFFLPSGAMAAQMREAAKTLQAKTAELSRDIAIKQAELEQTNAQKAIDQGIQLESQLISYVNNIEQRAFDSARTAATLAVETYNALVAGYRAQLEKYSTYASVYRTLMDGEQAKVAAYRAQVEAESTKATVNRTLIEQNRALIDNRNAEIALYRTQLEAVQTALQAERFKLEAFAERVKAYTAEINSETVRAEVFKTQVQSNAIRTDQFKTQVEAFSTQLRATADAYKTKADIYDAQVRAWAARSATYKTKVEAAAEQIRTATTVAGLQVEGFKAQTQANTANTQLQIENYRALVQLYESNKSLAVQRTKLLSDNYFALRALVADASKVAAQVNAQLAASAYGTIRASAGVSGSDSTSTSFSYSGSTSDSREAPRYT